MILDLKSIGRRQAVCHFNSQIAWITFLAMAAKMGESQSRIIPLRCDLPQYPVEASWSPVKMMLTVVYISLAHEHH